jgi:hypothetical protein
MQRLGNGLFINLSDFEGFPCPMNKMRTKKEQGVYEILVGAGALGEGLTAARVAGLIPRHFCFS